MKKKNKSYEKYRLRRKISWWILGVFTCSALISIFGLVFFSTQTEKITCILLPCITFLGIISVFLPPQYVIYTKEELVKKKWFHQNFYRVKKQKIFGDGFVITLTESPQNSREVLVFTRTPIEVIQYDIRLHQLVLF